jgi:hypothetical protein
LAGIDLGADINIFDIDDKNVIDGRRNPCEPESMATPFGACPQCASRMRIEKLVCWRCGTSVTGRIAIPLLATLPEEQARFVERFLAANGSLTQLQKEMGCSYPKVRRLMNETMAALRAEFEAAAREKEEILLALEDERLGGKEAAHLLRNLTGSESDGTHGS